jgi:hypothetical protein
MLLAWGVPKLLLEQAVPDFVSRFARLILPWALVLLVFLPRPQERSEGQVFDFFYALMVFQLGLVLVLGSVASMRFTASSTSVRSPVTVSGVGSRALRPRVLWSPLPGFGGLRTYFSRYPVSSACPSSSGCGASRSSPKTEPDSRRFLELSLAELARPAVDRGRPLALARRRRRVRKPGGAPRASQEYVASSFSIRSLEIVVYTHHALSPALALHSGSLRASSASSTRRSAARWRCVTPPTCSATHETGARLTHDVKNLLQSLYALISAAPSATGDDHGYSQLLQRQLPQVTQRLNATLERLRAPESATTELPMPAREWWAGIERRYAGSGVKLEGDIGADRAIPAPLFDSFVENAVENARAKARHEPGLAILVKLDATPDAIALEVRDTGGALAPIVAQRVFREPIERDSGLGIGLFHIGRQAADAGYRAALASNVDGDVRVRTLTPAVT